MLSDAYWEGYDAYQDGYSASDNPYYSDEPEWREWKEGYYDAAQDD